MERTWILVADEARARVFSAEKRIGPLTEQLDYVNPAERLPEHELRADEPGHGRGPGGGRHAYGTDEGMRDHEVQRFAADLVERLRQGRERGDYQRLYLVAAPKFLGRLRKLLDHGTAELVVDSIDKDLVGHKADSIRKHLPHRL